MDDFDDESKTAPVDLDTTLRDEPAEEVPVPQITVERISSEFESPPIHRSFEQRRAAVMRAITESKLN